MEELNQIMVKQLKNRYNDPTVYKRFVLGIDRQKMRLYDCEQNAQQDIIDSGIEPKSFHPPQNKSKFDFTTGTEKQFDDFKI